MMAAKRGRSTGDWPLIGVLKDAIRDRGLSLSELSKRTGVSNTQNCRFLSGERSLTRWTPKKLARFLGLRLAKDNDRD